MAKTAIISGAQLSPGGATPRTPRGTPDGKNRHHIERAASITPRIPRTICVVALYAAYGSNMDPAQMLLRCPHSPQRGTGWLEGWRLTFGGEELGWDGALTTVVEDNAQRVFVALYDVPEIDEKELDVWDGVNLGFYSKIKVRVQTLDGDVLAWLYVLDAYEGGLPSAERLTILVDAAVKSGAPADYLDWLRARPSNPPPSSHA